MNTFVKRETQLRYLLVNEAFIESNKSIFVGKGAKFYCDQQGSGVLQW